MPHFQQRDVADLSRQVRLSRKPRVAREQQSHAAVGHEQHDRFLIDVGLAPDPGRVRAQDFNGHPVQLELVAATSRAPLCPIALDRAEKGEIAGIRHRLARLQHIGRIERVEHSRQATKVIEMRMARYDRCQLGRAVTPQKRHHHAATGIAVGSPRSSIDQQPTSRRTAQCNGVALPDVQETYGEASTV